MDDYIYGNRCDSMVTIRLSSEGDIKKNSNDNSDMEFCSRCRKLFKKNNYNGSSGTYYRCDDCKSFSTYMNDIIYSCNIQ